MKNLIIKTVLSLFVLTGCLSDDAIFHDDNTGGIVEIYNFSANRSATATYPDRYLGDGEKDEALDFDVTVSFSAVDFPIIVNYTGNNGAPQDVTVTLAVDPVAANYLVDSKVADHVLPDDAYHLSATSVVISKGANRAQIQVSVNPANLQSGQKYVLGVRITNASAGTLSQNFAAGGFYFTCPASAE